MGFLGLFTRNKPKIMSGSTKKDGFDGWIKCTGCEEMVHSKELKENLSCCPKCDHHFRISAEKRIEILADKKSFKELFDNLEANDPLQFTDSKAYTDRIKAAQEKSGRKDAVIVGTCTMNKRKVALGVMNFAFMGGSMGSVVGEKLTRLIEHAIENNLPVVIVSASGGARMQESIYSLMQMAKTSAALARLHVAKLPFISILTNPTTGGVTASFASLGDVNIAEPEALIGFAGPRVVEQTIGQKLPDTAQKSEFLLEKGMIDCIAKRSELKEKVATVVDFLMDNDENVDCAKTRAATLDELIAKSKIDREKNKVQIDKHKKLKKR